MATENKNGRQAFADAIANYTNNGVSPDPSSTYGYSWVLPSGDNKIDKEKFMEWIEQYKGTDYYNQLLNAYNTYAGQQFSPNGLQSIGEFFGDMSARSNFNNTRWATFMDTLGRIQDAMHQENYTNPSAELARRKAAGINDDLSGANQIGSGTPGNIDQADMATPALNDGSEVITSIAQYGISFVSQIMSFAQGIQSLRAGSLANIAQDLSNHSSAMDLIAEEVMNGLGISDIKDIDKVDSTAFIDFLGGLAKDNSFNSSTKRVLNRYYSTMKQDTGTARIQALKMELAQRYFNARRGVATEIAHPLFDDDFMEFVGNLGEKWFNLTFNLDKLRISYETSALSGAGNEDVGVPYNGLGASEYDSRKTSNEANSAIASQQKAVESFFSEIYKDLSTGDKWYHKLGLVFLPLFRGLVTSLLTPRTSAGFYFGGPRTVNNSVFN